MTRHPSPLVPLRAEHGPAVLAFERRNRQWFASSVSDRGDAFFAGFDEQLAGMLADQRAGSRAFYVLTDADGAVVGRFNLYDVDSGTATVGYRVAQAVAGRGVATAALWQLCTLAAGLGVRTLTAATSDANVASQRVLIKAGFVADGAADPSELGGRRGLRFRRDLAGERDVTGERDRPLEDGSTAG